MENHKHWTLTIRQSYDIRQDSRPIVGVWLNKNPEMTVEELVFCENLVNDSLAERQRAFDASVDFANAFRAGQKAAYPEQDIRIIMHSPNEAPGLVSAPDNPFIKEIQVFPMITDADGSFRLINSTDRTDERAEFYDVALYVRDAETMDHLEDHPDYQEHDNLTFEEASRISAELQAKHPDAGFEWLEEAEARTAAVEAELRAGMRIGGRSEQEIDHQIEEWRRANAPQKASYPAMSESAQRDEEKRRPPEEVPVESPQLRARLERADWYYDYSDDGDVRRKGAKEIAELERDAASHAVRSPDHAAWISAVWDEHAPSEWSGKFAGYAVDANPGDRSDNIPSSVVPGAAERQTVAGFAPLDGEHLLDLEVLRGALRRADFNYSWADDSWNREEGRLSVETARSAFEHFAQKSHEHADLASFLWDAAVRDSGVKAGDAYILEHDRSLTKAQHQSMVNDIDRRKNLAVIEQLMTVPPEEWTNRHGEQFANAVEAHGGVRLRDAVGAYGRIDNMETLVGLGRDKPSDKQWLEVADRYFQVISNRDPALAEQVLPVIRVRLMDMEAPHDKIEGDGQAVSELVDEHEADVDIDANPDKRAMDRLVEDLKRALEMATYVVTDPSAKKMYLDPVTSFALENEGAGYQREITIFMPYGGLTAAASEYHRSSIHYRARQLSDKGFQDSDIPETKWDFENTREAEVEGAFTAYNVSDDEVALVVHFRELERGMEMPEIEEKHLSNLGNLHTAPFLTTNGIIQHSTRNMKAMSLDHDYMAATYMAIERKYSGPADQNFGTWENYKPMQRSDLASGWKRDIETPQGMAAFLKTDPLASAELRKAIERIYEVPAADMAKLFSGAEAYADEYMEPIYRQYKEATRQVSAPGETSSHSYSSGMGMG